MIFTEADKELIAETVRLHPQLDLLVERAERAVLDRFTECIGDERVVHLRGWADDPALLDEELRRCLVLTIAAIAELTARAPDPRVKQAVRGERSVTYGGAVTGMYRLLDRFDEREPLARI